MQAYFLGLYLVIKTGIDGSSPVGTVSATGSIREFSSSSSLGDGDEEVDGTSVAWTSLETAVCRTVTVFRKTKKNHKQRVLTISQIENIWCNVRYMMTAIFPQNVSMKFVILTWKMILLFLIPTLETSPPQRQPPAADTSPLSLSSLSMLCRGKP